MLSPLEQLREETCTIVESSHYISRYLLFIKHLDKLCTEIVEKIN